MRDIIVWHGQDRKLRHGAIDTLYDTGSFIKCSKFTVQISRESFSTWNFSLRRGNLTHGFSERSHISQDNQNVHILFKCQIFCHGQCNLRRNQTFHDRIVCEVQKHGNVVGNAAFFKSSAEEVGNIMFDTHGGKYNGKFFIGIISERRLLYDLGCQLVMRKSVSGEDRQLLTADQGGQSVDCRNSGADIVSRVFPHDRVERQAVDISFQLGNNGTQIVNGFSDSVECTTQHIRGKCDFHRMSGQSCVCIFQRHVLRAFKDLNHSFVFI